MSNNPRVQQSTKKDQSSYYVDCLGEGQERNDNLYLRKIAYRFLSSDTIEREPLQSKLTNLYLISANFFQSSDFWWIQIFSKFPQDYPGILWLSTSASRTSCQISASHLEVKKKSPCRSRWAALPSLRQPKVLLFHHCFWVQQWVTLSGSDVLSRR